MWALGVRKFDKSFDQRTTGLSEGWHRKVKWRLAALAGSYMQSKRLDWMIHMFIELVDVHVNAREDLAYLGEIFMTINCYLFTRNCAEQGQALRACFSRTAPGKGPGCSCFLSVFLSFFLS